MHCQGSGCHVVHGYGHVLKFRSPTQCQAANLAWQRLRKILWAPRNLQLGHRISLWKASILPTLMYGLAAVTPDANDVHRMLIKHTRAMAHPFARMQHESTQHIQQRCKVPTAAEQLLQEATALHKRLRLLLEEVPVHTRSNA